jgi:hypothetical protein
VGKLLIGFSVILMYKFLTNSCEVRSSFVEMERHALLKGINEMLPVLLHFSSVWITLEHISLKCTNYFEFCENQWNGNCTLLRGVNVFI